MKLFKNTHGRVFLVALALLLQLAYLIYILFAAGNYNIILYTLLKVISFLVVAHVINSESNPSVKLAWVVPILSHSRSMPLSFKKRLPGL